METDDGTSLIPYKYVRCKICGKLMKSVEFSHLWNKHGITIEEYEAMFPRSPRISIETLKKLGRHKEAKYYEMLWKEGLLEV